MSNQGGGGAKCVFLFLFVATIMFIIHSANYIDELKIQNEKRGDGRYDFTISCQSQVLTWISFSFFNFYCFMLVTSCMYCHNSERESHKRFRFRTGLFIAVILVPFMISWNIYGNVMIKQDYFSGGKDQTHSQSTQYPKGGTK